MSANFLHVLNPHLKAASRTLDSADDAFRDRARVAMLGSIIQSWYGFDSASLLDVLARNGLLNHLVFSEGEIPLSEFIRVQNECKQNGALKWLLLALLDDIEKAESKSPLLVAVAARIEDWMNQNCPRTVFFHQYSKSPISKVSCAFACEQNGDAPAKEEFLAALRDFFPIRDVEQYDGEDEGLKKWAMAHPIYKNFSEDRTHYIGCSSEEITLDRLPPFDNWHPTKRYIEQIAAACQRLTPETKVDIVRLWFANNFEVPNVFDYFYLFPEVLKPPPAPSLMRQMQKSYELPNRFRNCWHEITFQFAKGDPRTIDVSLVVHDKKDHFWVELVLDAKWRQPTDWGDIPAVTTKLKDSIYIAFHSLLKEKARQMIS